MLRRLGMLLIGWVLAIAVPELGGAAQKDKSKPAAKDNQLVRLGEVTARLTAVDATEKHLTIQYTQQMVVADPQAAAQNNAELVRRQQEILQDPNPFNRRQALMQLAAEHQRNQSAAFTVQDMSVDLELQASDDLRVRLLQPPPQFDDRGKPRPYTAKELKELKGPDPKQPGYIGDFDSLKPGQTVLVTVAQHKDLLKKPAPKGKPKVVAVPKKTDQPAEPMERLYVTRIVIVAMPPPE